MSQTIFSKIIAKEIPAKIVYEDENYLAFYDIEPKAPVHVLVIPKVEIPTVNDIHPDQAAIVGGLFITASKVMKQLGHTDFRTVINCGPGAQQTVFHLHLHVLAGRPFTWPPG